MIVAVLAFLALGIFALGLIAFRAAWLVTHPKRGWRPSNWTPSPLEGRRIQFKSQDGTRLIGWIKNHPDPIGTVLCVHGLGTNRTELEWRAYRLFKRSFSVFLFDFRACGDSDGSITTGGVREADDLTAALDRCKHEPTFGNAPIVVLADSMGGTVALNAASTRTEIRAIFTDGAFASMESAIGWGFTNHTGLPATPFRGIVVRIAEWISREQVSALSVIDLIGQIAPRPIQIAHGLADPLVPASDARLLYQHAREPKHIWLVPDAGHVVGAFVDPEAYTDRVARFFRRALKSKPDLELTL